MKEKRKLPRNNHQDHQFVRLGC